MKSFSKASILFVDDDQCMREVMALLLNDEGYEVSTAGDGFDALAQLRNSVPNLIISDLHMPGMSGVEFLSVVRRRFPFIPVIAISGAHAIDEDLPIGVMADAFYPKGRCHPDALMRTIDEMMRGPLKRPTNYRPCQPPAIQHARVSRDWSGIPALLLICSECLRTFELNAAGCLDDGVLQTHCNHCRASVRFSIETPEAPAVVLTARDRVNPRAASAA